MLKCYKNKKKAYELEKKLKNPSFRKKSFRNNQQINSKGLSFVELAILDCYVCVSLEDDYHPGDEYIEDTNNFAKIVKIIAKRRSERAHIRNNK